jgi:hypothetical protein
MKFQSTIIFLSLLLFGPKTYAHGEGHGPQLTDSGKYGGLVSPLVDTKDAKKGSKAALVYKAELVRSTDGTVRIYLYDTGMNPLDLSNIHKKAEGILSAKVKGKFKEIKFDLSLEGNAFVGKAPISPSKPFNLDFHFKEKNRNLLTAFENLD